MNIETKFKVGDNVFTIDPETLKIKQFEIGTVASATNDKGTNVLVYPKGKDCYKSADENKCFSTKEALLDYITKP